MNKSNFLSSTASNNQNKTELAPKVAFVFDWLVNYNMGGGEKVLAALMELWPDAPVFTLVHDPTGPCAALTYGKQVNTSLIQYLPGAKHHHRLYLPLMPFAIGQLDLGEFDLIISCSHAFAHSVQTRRNQLHINYIFTPFRYAWELDQNDLNQLGLGSSIPGLVLNAFVRNFKKWDARSIQNINQFVAISEWVAEKVNHAYKREADVIYPPVDAHSFSPEQERKDFYLTISRLVPYKRVDIICEAFARMPDKKLFVIGEGPEKHKLAANATPNIKFLGYQPFEALKSYLESAQGFVYAAVEDFGISPIEAQAAGAPVIGYRKGGLLETVIDGETGIFFDSQTPQSIIEAVRRFESSAVVFDPLRLHEHALKFNKQRFKKEIQDFVMVHWERFKNEQQG